MKRKSVYEKQPPHWYFPISYEEMRKRRKKAFQRALKKAGLTMKDLQKHKPKQKRKRRKKRR